MDRGRNLDELPRAFNPHTPVERSSMKKSIHVAAVLMLSLAAGSLAHAQSGPSPQEQMACRSDAGKFCAEHIGKPPQMNTCLRANKPKLSDGCRKVVESHGG
ncbi:hypothetical protein [Bradyrhizobium sp. URHC0002]